MFIRLLLGTGTTTVMTQNKNNNYEEHNLETFSGTLISIAWNCPMNPFRLQTKWITISLSHQSFGEDICKLQESSMRNSFAIKRNCTSIDARNVDVRLRLFGTNCHTTDRWCRNVDTWSNKNSGEQIKQAQIFSMRTCIQIRTTTPYHKQIGDTVSHTVYFCSSYMSKASHQKDYLIWL